MPLKSKVLTLLLLLFPVACIAKLVVTDPRVENLREPLGIDTATPRFSWMTEATGKKAETGVLQTGYRILVASSATLLDSDRGDLWDSGEVSSAEQLWISYRGRVLKSNQHVWWKVRVTTNRGATDWSRPQRFSTGLLGETAWSGRWIGLERLMPGERQGETHSRLAARYLRKTFTLKPKPIRRATAFIAGLGLYQLYVGGQRIGSDVLTPVPSDYRKTIYYDTYDVTAALTQAVADTAASPHGTAVAVGVVLGNGRYFAMRQDKPYKNVTFGLPKCRLNILVEYADGKSERLVTDETWRVSADGPVRANNDYDGEEYDSRRSLGAWTTAGYDDRHWQAAERTAIPTGTLRGRHTPGIVVLGPGTPVAERLATGVLDFGRNMSGWLSFVPRGKAGDTIRVRYAERLDGDGRLYTANLRDARSEDIYVCDGGAERWRPAFVTHGFRYAQVSGPASDFLAEEVADDMAAVGTFSCSDTILNRVVDNARRGIRSNYKGVPVDCPQRNERQPWLGDRTAGSLGESFIFGNERLYTKWMRDICEAQREDGCIPDVAPAFWNYYTDNVTWPAALPFTCDMLWRQYGNDEALRRWYPNIRLWLTHILENLTSKDGLVTKDKYGDWCVPPEKPELIHSEDPARQTDGMLLATAYTIGCMRLAESFAGHLGLGDDATYWAQRRDLMSAAFNRRFLTCKKGTSPRPGHPLYPDSVYYGNNTATANLLPLAFAICPDTLRAEVAKQVVENIVAKNGCHVSCGVIGISWLLRTLTDNGYGDVAYLVATQKTYPSWGYMAERGATTVWELWNGDTADPSMNSGNHVMLLGDLLTWCYQSLGGIRQADDSRAYRHTVLRPDFTISGCDHADCTYRSPYGLIESRWRKTPTHVDWHVTVPCNTTADVCLPDGSVRTVGSGSHHFAVDLPAKDAAIVRDEFLFEQAPFASPHAPTIVETRRGDLVCAYFAGTYERNPDCCIYVSIKKKGSDHWESPILAAHGRPIAGDTSAMAPREATACWNPVLFEMADGELWLFYKIGKRVADWSGWLVKSRDGGRTWSRREPLPEGFLGPVKNKPLIVGDYLVCGSSTESQGWRFHVERLNLKTGAWQYIGPVAAEEAVKTDDGQRHPIDCIQPSLLRHQDGTLQVLMRTHNARLATSYSHDGGQTWTPVTLTTVENNQSGTDAVTLADGRHVLAYNNFATLNGTKKGPRTPLSLAVSSDGTHWRHWLTLEDCPAGEYSYPAIVQGRDGSLHVTYTWRRQRIAYKQLRLP